MLCNKAIRTLSGNDSAPDQISLVGHQNDSLASYCVRLPECLEGVLRLLEGPSVRGGVDHTEGVGGGVRRQAVLGLVHIVVIKHT